MIDLLSKAGLTALHAFIDRHTLLAFDLDGTLVPIVANPGSVQVPESIRAGLSRLIGQATVAVITGRAINDARERLGVAPQLIVGNHGAEGLPGRRAQERSYIDLCREWEWQLRTMLPPANASGIRIENKGATLSLHYREAADRDTAHILIMEAMERLAPAPRRVSGKCVENLVAVTAPGKGAAMLELMHRSRCCKGFYAGDDVTDEDVFRLDGPHLFTVRVGDDADSRARYLLRDQRDMALLLTELAGALTAGCRKDVSGSLHDRRIPGTQ